MNKPLNEMREDEFKDLIRSTTRNTLTEFFIEFNKITLEVGYLKDVIKELEGKLARQINIPQI